MTSTANTTNSEQRPGLETSGAPHPQAVPRVLFLSWTEPDVVSGTPVILCDMMSHFPPGHTELLCEKSYNRKNRRKISLAHPVRKVRFPYFLWPFHRGARVRAMLAYVGFPWLVLVGCWHVLRFRPTGLVAIYYRVSWVFAAYLISRICRVPLVYHIHDALRENYDGKHTLHNRFSAWVEARALRGARVAALDPHMADHYLQRYGIECPILRHVVWRKPLPRRPRENRDGPLIIGFAGAVYENTRRQLAELSAIVARHPRFRFKIWSGARAEVLAEMGIAGEGVEIGFEADYDRLLERLSECDLLYLPLSFHDTGSLTTDALQYSFPTKSLDYLLAGPPILVHCPEEFELARFFREQDCGHLLTDGDPDRLVAWLEAFAEGRIADSDAAARRRALELFSPQENRRVLWRVLSEAASQRHGASHNLQRS